MKHTLRNALLNAFEQETKTKGIDQNTAEQLLTDLLADETCAKILAQHTEEPHHDWFSGFVVTTEQDLIQTSERLQGVVTPPKLKISRRFGPFIVHEWREQLDHRYALTSAKPGLHMIGRQNRTNITFVVEYLTH